MVYFPFLSFNSILSEDYYYFFWAFLSLLSYATPGRFFPCVVVSIGGMNCKTKYNVALELNPVDHFHYEHILSKWERHRYAPQAYHQTNLATPTKAYPPQVSTRCREMFPSKTLRLPIAEGIRGIL